MLHLEEDAKPYQRETSWTGKGSADYYLVDIPSGIKKAGAERKRTCVVVANGKIYSLVRTR